MTHRLIRASAVIETLARALARSAGILLVTCMAFGSVCAQAQQLTPAQMAYLKAETRKADESFVKDVAEIVGTRTSVVSKALPESGRITDPVVRLIAGLERSLGKTLTEEQKTAIQAADLERQKHVEWASTTARKR